MNKVRSVIKRYSNNKKLFFVFLCFISALSLTILLRYVSLRPRANRNWQDKTRIISNISQLEDDGYLFSDIRNWSYDQSGPVTKETVSDTYHPEDLTEVWFLVEPFSDWDAIAHTYLTFDFKDKKPLSFSIEARMEEGEDYSALAGMFKQYELAHIWGYESDLLVRRVVFLENDVYMYKLTIPHNWKQRLFTELIRDTQELKRNPQWYDTVTDNCTNALAKIINGFAPNTLPFDASWFLTGNSARYLQSLGYINQSDEFNQLKSESRVNTIVSETYTSNSMSESIRTFLVKQD